MAAPRRAWLGYNDVLPYFKRMEHSVDGANEWRGTGGPMTVSDQTPFDNSEGVRGGLRATAVPAQP